MSSTDEDQMSTTSPAESEGSRTLRQSFRHFRRSRPFWGCIILALGGFYVLRPVVGSFQMMTALGGGGAMVYLLGGGMIASALIAFFVPSQRYFPAIMALLFSVASLPLANLGGWIVGMTLGIIGSGMVFAWTPYTEAEIAADAERHARRQRGRARRA